jgi:nucleotide-binding universal stress UspA family protein
MNRSSRAGTDSRAPDFDESCTLVLYEPSAGGRAALMHAAHRARAKDAPLVVLAVTPQAPVDSGCLRCRGSAALWNLAMAEVADEELQQARQFLAGAEPEDVRYVVGRGDPVRAITAAAAEVRADCVIVSPEPRRRVPLPRRRSLASRLGTDRPFTVLCPPPIP